MQYKVSGQIDQKRHATYSAASQEVVFGVLGSQQDLPNPAELLLGSFAACCLKNIQRFSELLNFEYQRVSIEVVGERQEQPTKMIAIRYIILIYSSNERINPTLLHKNLRKFGTIYNTLKEVCDVSGELKISA